MWRGVTFRVTLTIFRSLTFEDSADWKSALLPTALHKSAGLFSIFEWIPGPVTLVESKITAFVANGDSVIVGFVPTDGVEEEMVRVFAAVMKRLALDGIRGKF